MQTSVTTPAEEARQRLTDLASELRIVAGGVDRPVSSILSDPEQAAFISPSSHVGIIGPGVMAVDVSNQVWGPMDPNVIFFAQYLKNHGALSLVDLPSQDRDYGASTREGARNLSLVKAHLDQLSQVGASLCQIQYLIGSVLDAPVFAALEDAQAPPAIRPTFDCLVDHGTFGYMRFSYRGDGTWQERVVENYTTLLGNKGGKILFYSLESELEYLSGVLGPLQQSGWSVTVYTSIDYRHQIHDPAIAAAYRDYQAHNLAASHRRTRFTEPDLIHPYRQLNCLTVVQR